VQPLPVVVDELLRVRRGFEVVALEAGQASLASADVDTLGVGTTACEAAVAGGLRDLEIVLARLEAVAADCLRALSRYDGTAAQEGP
jgi:hypothetical protein